MSEPIPADRLRVGDDERQQAVSALGEHFAAGRLDQGEFDTRVQAAYAARTRVELRGLFGDLPDPAPFRDRPAGWVEGRSARDRRPSRRPGPPAGFRPPVAVIVPVLVAAAVASALLHAPVLPLVILAWFLVGRRVWR
jgi:hypothetical protein